MKTAVVNARIDPKIKKSAEKILNELGISMSQAVSMFLAGVTAHKGIPFDVKIPNATTRRAMADGRAGRLYRANSFADIQRIVEDEIEAGNEDH